ESLEAPVEAQIPASRIFVDGVEDECVDANTAGGLLSLADCAEEHSFAKTLTLTRVCNGQPPHEDDANRTAGDFPTLRENSAVDCAGDEGIVAQNRGVARGAYDDVSDADMTI